MNRPARPAMIGAFAAIYLFWGGTFLAIRYVVADLPPLLTIGLRCAGGAVLLFAWLGVRGRLERVSAAAWGTAFLAGALLFLGCHAVMASVEQRVSSGETALWMTAIPLWLVVLDAVRSRRFPALSVLVGLALGAGGVAVLSAGDGLHPERARDHLALLACAFSWALGSLVARHGPRPASAVQSTAMQLATGGTLVLLGSALFESWSGVQLTARGAASLGFLVVCGTTIALACYTWLLRVTTPAGVGTYAFVNPVIALLLGWAVGDDTLGWRTVLATVLVVSAVLVTQWRGLVGSRPKGPVDGQAVTPTPRASSAPGAELRGASWIRLS